MGFTRVFIIGTSWKMTLFKCFVHDAIFSFYKIITLIIIMIMIMKIITTIINRSADLKIRNAGRSSLYMRLWPMAVARGK